jgi:uncharacterized protein YwqG
MFFSDPVKKLKPWAERNARTAYAPVTEPGHGPDRGSRFNGSPFLAEGEAWPACKHCAKPMPLFLQLDLDELPGEYAGKFGSGLLQLFYCVGECEVGDSEAWAAFDHTSKLARVIPRDAAGAIAAPRDTGLRAQPQSIKGWASHSECCNWEEAEAHGIKSDTKREGDRYKTRFRCAELGVETGWLGDVEQDKPHAQIFNPRNRDKLGGWPYWVQGVEYPNCPQCQTQMRLVFQIDSDDHVPWMFGDVGCGHITQCPNHHDVVTFGWACS